MSGVIARRYAKAVFSLAREEQALEETAAELERLASLARDPELGGMLANPLLSQATRKALAETLASQLQLRSTTRNFVLLLADNGRMDQLIGIHDVYQRLVDQTLGRVRARLTSATALTPIQQEQVVTTFERITGKKVLAAVAVDPDLLGGVVVEVVGTVYDGSLRTQLGRLAAAIAGNRSDL